MTTGSCWGGAQLQDQVISMSELHAIVDWVERACGGA
jgi:hypothetical protein